MIKRYPKASLMNGHIVESRRVSLGWSWLALFLAAAALTGGGVGAMVARGIGSTAPDLPTARGAATATKFVMPDRVYLPAVAAQDYNPALDTMGLSPSEERQLRGQIEAGKVR